MIRQISIKLLDGDAKGIIIARIVDRLARVVIGPKCKLTELRGLPEAAKSGAYFLVGETADGKPHVYVGKAASIEARLQTQKYEREWHKVGFVTMETSDDNFNEAHAKHVEKELASMAKTAKRAKVTNDQEHGTTLSGDEIPRMDEFIEHILCILSVLDLGMDFFNPAPARPSSMPTPEEVDTDEAEGGGKEFVLAPPKLTMISARAIERGNKFIVLAKATGRVWKNKKRENSTYARLQKQLIDDGVVEANGNTIVFLKTWSFIPQQKGKYPSARSAAESVLWGDEARGHRWKPVKP